MTINPVTSSAAQAVLGNDPFTKAKQTFDELGSALKAGKLVDAKKALDQLKQNAPAQAANGNNPISEKMDALSKAVDSGDLKAAQNAYADIKKAMPQRPGASTGGAGGSSGPPPGGAPGGGASKSSGTSGSTSSSKVYDKKDTNEDGTVSLQEELAYSVKHRDDGKQSAAIVKDSEDTKGNVIDTST
jgi:soluble cytochrome b562